MNFMKRLPADSSLDLMGSVVNQSVIAGITVEPDQMVG